MKTLKTILMLCCISLFFNGNPVFAQSREKSKNQPVPSQDKKADRDKEEPGDYFSEDEVQSPFRYVVVKNDLQFDDDENKVPVRRFVDVLMDERAFNEANLIYLFTYLSNFYAEPTYLNIEVHTSLMTLETLEESAALSTHSSRDRFRQIYRTAGYSRFNDGGEIFDYDTGKPGNFIRKTVNLPQKTKK